MDYDAFSAGVEPGGLRNTRDIGILICYMLDYLDKPFSQDDLINTIQENGIANYFEVSSAMSELIKINNVAFSDESAKTIVITDNGRLISHQLSSELSVSVRQKAIASLLKLTEERIIEKENPVIISKVQGGGYNVTMQITDGIRDLMSLTLFVPDRSIANSVKRQFHKNPQKVYSIAIASLIQEKELIDEAVKELQNE